MKKKTLCWKCANAVPDARGHGCEWTVNYKPVPGWDASPTKLKNYKEIDESYLVERCPRFEPDGSTQETIMQTRKECYVTRKTNNLHKHHIFGGSRRKASDLWGCWVWLTPAMHNMSNDGVHFNKALDTALKQECQRRFEDLYGHEKFMEVFGKNYL